MQNWDRLAMLLISGGVAAYTAWGGWRLWQKRERQAAAGAFLLAAATAALPIALALFNQ